MKGDRSRRVIKDFEAPGAGSRYWSTDARLRPPQYDVRLLDRARLMARLDEVLKATLTLVRTPAGYGKTTLLTQWCQHLTKRGVTALWIALEEEDREPEQFVSYLALAASVKGFNSRPLGRALHRGASGMTPEELIKSLLHEFQQLDGPIVLLLDDYHLIESPENDYLVSQLVRHHGSNLHVVLASRTKPVFPLSTLRTTGRLQELGAKDLRFSEQEAIRFLGDLMKPREAALLVERTEGWPVGLQLARLWAREQADPNELITGFCGSTQDMAAYMVDRVMLRLPETTREFLLQTSILERINGDLANAVCNREDSWQILDELERLSALIFPVDSGRTWYRHHHLFADFLRAQLQRRGESKVRLLHTRASRWFLAKDEIYEAVKHACKGGEVEYALTMLDQAGLFYRMLRDGAESYKRLRTLFSRQSLDAYPRVAMAQVLLLIKEGELWEGRALLEDIKRKLADGNYGGRNLDREQLAQEILVTDCFLGNYLDAGVSAESIAAMEAFAGSVDPGDHWYRAVLNNLLCTMHWHHGNLINAMATAHASIENFAHAGLDYGLFFVNLHLGCLRVLHGTLTGGMECFNEARRLADEVFPFDANIRALSQIFLAEACFEKNRLDEAGEYIFDALKQVQESDGWIEVYVSAYRTALGTAFSSRKLKGVQPVLEMGRKFARKRKLKRLEWFLLMREISYVALSGDTEEARRLIDRAAPALREMTTTFDEAQIWREREEYLCTLGRVLIFEGSPHEAIAILEPLARACEESEHIWRLIQALILLGVAYRAVQDMDQAAHHLRRAMLYTRNEGSLRIFLDEGPPVQELLKGVVAHVGVSALSGATLDWAAEILAGFSATRPDSEMSLVNSVLTVRERDVLQHLKSGGSNKVIARRLDITENAVKFHLKNIYRKLGVNDRRLAISLADRHGLLAG